MGKRWSLHHGMLCPSSSTSQTICSLLPCWNHFVSWMSDSSVTTWSNPDPQPKHLTPKWKTPWWSQTHHQTVPPLAVFWHCLRICITGLLSSPAGTMERIWTSLSSSKRPSSSGGGDPGSGAWTTAKSCFCASKAALASGHSQAPRTKSPGHPRKVCLSAFEELHEHFEDVTLDDIAPG